MWGVINWQRRFEAYAAAQRARRWDQAIEAHANVDSCDVRVGVMGFGAWLLLCILCVCAAFLFGASVQHSASLPGLKAEQTNDPPKQPQKKA